MSDRVNISASTSEIEDMTTTDTATTEFNPPASLDEFNRRSLAGSSGLCSDITPIQG
jgi:hypothetical protein